MVMSDVVKEILSRLLVKDLLPCKSVCKSWYSLISSPSFVRTHLKFMCNKKDINTRRIAIAHRWGMQGSSNGLVCMYTGYESQVIITNPLTREFRELAEPPDLLPMSGYVQCWGFGYDSSTDDYKVVLAICTRYGRVLVQILSLKSDTWKLFGQTNYWSGTDMPGILFNGALHWFWFDATYPLYEKALIVSFDLANEEFREIPQPDDKRYVWNKCSTLGIIEGCLCIFCKEGFFCFNNHPCNIWVMKNYNGKPSWELLPITDYCQLKDLAIHYMLSSDSNEYRITPFCDENIQLSWGTKHIQSPMFVQTLVSPYVNNNNNGIPSRTKNNESSVSNWRPSDTKNNESSVSNGRPSHAKNNKSTINNGRPSHIKHNESSVSNGRASHAKNNKSTINNRRPSHAKNNKSSVKAWSVKEKRETEEEERGVVTNTYKKGSKGKERLLKSFWKKKGRVTNTYEKVLIVLCLITFYFFFYFLG